MVNGTGEAGSCGSASGPRSFDRLRQRASRIVSPWSTRPDTIGVRVPDLDGPGRDLLERVAVLADETRVDVPSGNAVLNGIPVDVAPVPALSA
jgi:hypothetical protein